MSFLGSIERTNSSVQSGQIDREQLGPPGLHGYLHIFDVRPDEPRSEEQRIADRTPRPFHVCALLAKSYAQHEGIRGVMTPDEGGCFVTTSRVIRINTPSGPYEVVRNSRQELALITRFVTATCHEDAFDVFMAGLTPSLDHLSYLSNTPIIVDRLQCRDEANHLTVISYRTPFGNVNLSEGSAELLPTLIPVYGLYREALSANSNFYRFLCFYKILEGIFCRLHPALVTAARKQGISLATRQELVPDDAELRRVQPNCIGRKIKPLYEGEFQKQYRDSVAHFALDKRGVTNPSAHREGTRFANMMYLAQVCAKEVIRNQEDYFRDFVRAGGDLRDLTATIH